MAHPSLRSPGSPARHTTRWRDTLFFRLLARLGIVASAFLVIQLALVVRMYVASPAELDQLLVSAEADRIAHNISSASQGVSFRMTDELLPPFAEQTRRAFIVHDRAGHVVTQHDDGDLVVAGAAPASFLVINTQRESWGDRFLLSGTRQATVEGQPLWITVAISGQGVRPFIPVVVKEIRFHVLLPLLVISGLFLLANFSIVRSMLKPLGTAIEAVDAIDPAVISARVTTPGKSWEVQALIAAVNRMLERVERSVLTLRDFTGHAAHELRTPLAIMMLGISELPAGLNKDKLSRDVQSMKRLVDQMLDMAQASALIIEGAAEADLTQIAAEVVTDLTPLAVARNRSITFHDAGGVVIRGHAEAIGRALRNVIENGLSHTPPGTSVDVIVGQGPRFVVRDRGPGIPVDQRDNVLQRFHRLDRRKTNGAGLGLAIALAIVREHEGSIEITDAPEGGAVVCLTFHSKAHSNATS